MHVIPGPKKTVFFGHRQARLLSIDPCARFYRKPGRYLGRAFFFDRSCSPGERSDPGDRGDKTHGYSIWLAPPPDFASLIRATQSSAPRTHGAQHRFARPAINLEAGGLL